MAWASKIELMRGPCDGAIVDIGGDVCAGECFRVARSEGTEALYVVIPGTTFDDRTPDGRLRAKFREMIHEKPHI